MSFAGHLKSISLHNGVQSAIESSSPPTTTLHIEAEKEALRKQVRLKELELEHLRKATNISSPVKTTGKRGSDARPRKKNLTDLRESLVDDRGNEPSRSLWIGNTPTGVKTSELRAVFNKYGPIVSTKPLGDCAFVNYAEVESAIQAWKECHEKEIFERGRALYIRFTGTQAESRRLKDIQSERTSSLHAPAHIGQADRSHFSPERRSSAITIGTKDATEWPNGLPPAGPKSHRRDISPPVLSRITVRCSPEPSTLDIHRLSHECGPRALERECQGATYNQERADSHSSERLLDDMEISASRSEPGRHESSEESPAVRGAGVSQSVMLAEAKAKLLRRASSTIALQQFDSSPAKHDLADQAIHSEHLTPSLTKRHLDIAKGNAIDADNDGSQYPNFRTAVTIADDIEETSDTGNVILHEEITASPPSMLTSASTSALLPPNKRLKLDRDDMSSTRSERSSTSNCSSRDRRCRACKKLGNEKGLHILVKCASCTRRYHSFCGRPRPNQSADPSKFVCEKCIRKQRQGLNDLQVSNLSDEHDVLQLVSPPLSHVNHEHEFSNTDQRQISQPDFDPRPQRTVFQFDTPPSPATVSFDGTDFRAATDRREEEDTSASKLLTRYSGSSFETDELLISMGRRNSAKYKGVTCPWWQNGNRCWLREDDCLYAHTRTRILSPDGYNVNRDWTCYYWLNRINCPRKERECLNSHYDTGLHAGRDGRASLKHVTCFWWITRGSCKHDTHVCRYAHSDTGLYSRDPSDKRSGMAISTTRPQSFPATSPSRPRYSEAEGIREESQLRDRDEKPALARGESTVASHDEILDHFNFPADSTASHAKTSSSETMLTQSMQILDGADETDCLRTPTEPISPLQTLPANLKSSLPVGSIDLMGFLKNTVAASSAYLARSQVTSMNETPSAADAAGLSAVSHTLGLEKQTEQSWDRMDMMPSYGLDLGALDVQTEATRCSKGSAADPRRRLRLATAKLSYNTGEARPEMVDAQSATRSPALKMARGVISKTQTTPTQSFPDDDTTTTSSTSYKKCKLCGKIVFSGDTCRECKMGKKTSKAASPNPQQQLEEQPSVLSDALALSTSDKDDIQRCIEDDKLVEPHQVQEPPPIPIPRVPTKRNSSTDTLFIANKRPRNLVQFSRKSARGLVNSVIKGDRTSFSQVHARAKLSHPPTLDQLIEEQRLENNRRSHRGAEPSIVEKQRTNEGWTNHSDKENDTPASNEGPSSSETTPIDTQNQPNDDNMNDEEYSPAPATGMGLVRSASSSDSNSGDESRSPTAFEYFGEKPPTSCQSARDIIISSIGSNLHRGSTKDSQARALLLGKEQKRSCEECAKKHKRCPHRNESDALYSSNAASLPEFCVASSEQPRPLIADERASEQSRPAERAPPFVCDYCRAHRQRCLHSTDGSQLDGIKCLRWLRDRNFKKDTSRSRIEWESILSAAEIQQNDASSSYWDMEESEPYEVSEAVHKRQPNPLLDSQTSGEESSTQRTHSRRISTEVDLRTNARSLPANKTITEHVTLHNMSTLMFDDHHIAKLKNEGVMFESDEEDADYLDSEQESVPLVSEALFDPLYIPPKSSRNLFEICPELHPEYVRRSRIASEEARQPTRRSRKAEWAELRTRRLNERRELYGNPHWEVQRKPCNVEVSTLVMRLVPTADEDLTRFAVPSVEKREESVTFQEFLGGPRRPEACIAFDGALAFRDGARDVDQTSFARSARGFGRRATDEDKYPVYDK